MKILVLINECEQYIELPRKRSQGKVHIIALSLEKPQPCKRNGRRLMAGERREE